MVKSQLVIVWNNRAKASFREAIKQIKKDSYSNGEKVKDVITKLVDELVDNPERYPLDKYKNNNTGNCRAFEKYRFRIAYRHTSKEIRILKFRSTDQEPKLY